jgi:hypothetical protein
MQAHANKNVESMADQMWHRMINTFKVMAEPRLKESKYLSMYKVTEQSLRENFSKIFGAECDILARIIYIKISRRKDHAKINFL